VPGPIRWARPSSTSGSAQLGVTVLVAGCRLRLPKGGVTAKESPGHRPQTQPFLLRITTCRLARRELFALTPSQPTFRRAGHYNRWDCRWTQPCQSLLWRPVEEKSPERRSSAVHKRTGRHHPSTSLLSGSPLSLPSRTKASYPSSAVDACDHLLSLSVKWACPTRSTLPPGHEAA